MSFIRNDNIGNYIKDFVDKARVRVQPFIITGELNREYIKGNQNKKIDPRTKTIIDKQFPKDIYLERKVFNRMLSIFLTRNGILSDNKPIPGFQPDNADAKSVAGAIIGNRFLREFMKENDFDTTYKKLIKSGDTFPMVWVKTGIDWNHGEEIGEVQVKTSYNGKDSTKLMKVREGRPFINIVPIYEVFPDNLKCDNMSEMKELVYRTPMELDYIESKYGYTPTAEHIDAMYTMNRYDLNLYVKGDRKYAYVYEYYKRPDSMYPNGRFITMINNHIIQEGDLPYKNGYKGKRDIPFDVLTFQQMDGYIPGVTVYSQLIDQQDTYNATMNRFLEYVNRLGIGKKYAWKGSIIENTNPSNKPGTTTWLTRFGRPPVNDQIDRIGNELFMYLKGLEENMLITAGLSALTAYGQTKSNIRTDGVADKIADSDSNKLTNALKNLSSTIISVMKKVIYLEQERQNILTEELGLGDKDEYISKYDMRFVDAEEVIIVNREFLMKSDQIIDKKMAQAANLGLYNPQAGLSYRSKLEVLDMIQAGYLKDTLDPMERANWSQIQFEHTKLYDGEVLEAQEYEMHPMHVQEHTLELMSPRMLELKEKEPDKYQGYLEMLNKHMQEHKQFMQQSQRQQAYAGAKAAM